MFSLGIGEIILILIALLIFVGPDHLPDVLKGIARFMAKIRNTTDRIRDEMDEIYYSALLEDDNKDKNNKDAGEDIDEADTKDYADKEMQD